MKEAVEPPALLPEEVEGGPDLAVPGSVLPEPGDWDFKEVSLRRTLLFVPVFKPEDWDPWEATLEASLPDVPVEPED